MLIRKIGLLGCALALTLMNSTASAHDRCDSAAYAATAAGVFYPPAAGFQVGYFLAKQIDELTAATNAAPGNLLDNQCLASGGFGNTTAEVYEKIINQDGLDGNNSFLFLWEASGALVQKSLKLNEYINSWQNARIDVHNAENNGFSGLDELARLQVRVDAAHELGMEAFEAYRKEQENYIVTLQIASEIMPELITTVPALTVDDVAASANELLEIVMSSPDITVRPESKFDFEFDWFTQVGCVSSDQISSSGVLAPAYRFIHDDVAPGTFLNDDILKSPASIYSEVASAFNSEVLDNIADILPEGFLDNEPLQLVQSDQCPAVFTQDTGVLHVPVVRVGTIPGSFKADFGLNRDLLPNIRFDLLDLEPNQ